MKYFFIWLFIILMYMTFIKAAAKLNKEFDGEE